MGQKFGKHIDDSVEVQPGHVTGYTLLIYLSGTPQQQPGPIDTTVPTATTSSSSSAQARGGSGKAKKQKQGPAAVSSSSSLQPAQINTSALQQIVGGETVFYGEPPSAEAAQAAQSQTAAVC